MDFQQEELNEILNIFQQESAEIISSMDKELLELERNPNSEETAIQLFRNAHSLKGSARMLGFNEIQNIVHKIEDVISLIKENKMIITSSVADFLCECLDFVSDLINKTVQNKEEYISEKTQIYVEKLIEIAEGNQNNYVAVNIEEEVDINKKAFFKCLDEIENFIIQTLYISSKARQDKDFNLILRIEKLIQNMISILAKEDCELFLSLKNIARNILNALDKFKDSDDKDFASIQINNEINIFIEQVEKYAQKEKIQIKEYFEIVDEMLASNAQIVEKKDAVVVESEKLNDFLQKIPLLEINSAFMPEVLEALEVLSVDEKNAKIKEIYLGIKEIILAYKSNEKTLTHDICLVLKNVLEAIKSSNNKEIEENIKKFNAVKTMAIYQQKENVQKQADKQINPKEILNTITNTEIKTLRIDSVKLDNLVGELGELIVSKIKTNEQLSLTKKINNDLLEWQKNFLKMSYYIKYFDKKYLSDENFNENRKIISYNKQLSTLVEQHAEEINFILKDIGNLFKQLQESETKLNATTREIEAMVKNMRILPLSAIFQLFPRMVHNIAKEKGKKIELVIEGQDVTADKTIIEEIKIPLMHIIRNSIDHGIEDVETRRTLGKNPTGLIKIAAAHKDNNIVIDIKDDGRGLDIEKIKQKALEKKILSVEEINAIGDNELTNLIFYPGFSTEEFVTELSGRGLGLDIVNNKINDLQGRIDVFSELNKGTVVRLTLPSAVASKKVFVIEENDQLWAIETSVIRTIIRMNSFDVFEKENNNYYIYNNNAIQIYTLSQILGFENKPRKTEKYTLLVIEADNTTFGIIVEKLISDQEIVHKKISPPLYKIKNISGITTLANGEACLIINISDVLTTIGSKKIKTKIIAQNVTSKAKENSKYRILVVDDSYTTRILQQNILTRNGYNVSCATNPNHALEKIENERYDLILSDVQMPFMNGFEFIKELRKKQEYEKVPVIVVSSEPIENYAKEIKETQIIKYIPKNLFKQNTLIDCIEKVLNG